MTTNTPDGSNNEPKETFRVQRRRRTDPDPGGRERADAPSRQREDEPAAAAHRWWRRQRPPPRRSHLAAPVAGLPCCSSGWPSCFSFALGRAGFSWAAVTSKPARQVRKNLPPRRQRPQTRILRLQQPSWKLNPQPRW